MNVTNLKPDFLSRLASSILPSGGLVDANVTSGIQTIGLDTDKAYSIAHEGVDHNNNVDTNYIYFATSGITGFATGHRAALDKFRLIMNRPIILGPGVSTLFFKSSLGAPQFTIIASTSFFGKF